MKKLALLLSFLICVFVMQAGATVVIGTPGSNLNMPVMNYFGGGPITVGNYTWSSTNTCCQGGSVFGYNGGYGFGDNGEWGGLTMAGLNDSYSNWGVTDTMTFAFTNPVSWTGGFFNYYPGSSDPTTLAVWDSSHNLIESYNLTFLLTPGAFNQGKWIQFQETTPIAYLTMTGNYVSVSAGAVPEPGTILLLGSGVLGLAGVIRRKINL